MMTRGWMWVGVCVALLASGRVMGAAKPEPVDPYVEGSAAFRAQKWAAAIDDLAKFMGASVGDPRIEQAGDMLDKSLTARAAQLKSVSPRAAAEMLVSASKRLKTGTLADKAKEDAYTLIKEGYAKAIADKDYDQAVALATTSADLFADKPALADAEKLQAMRVSAIAAMVRKGASAEAVYTRVSDALAAKVPAAALEKEKIVPSVVTLAYAKALMDRGWYAEAVHVMRGLKDRLPNEVDRKTCISLMTRANQARVDAWNALPNVGSFSAAVRDCDADSALMAPDAARATKLQTALGKLSKGRDTLHSIKVTEPLVGDGKWQDDGAGYTIDGTVTIGGTADSKDANGNVDVQAGFVLTGGKIEVLRGKFRILGTAERPVIFRNVELTCSLRGEIFADHVIFEDCKFSKSFGPAWAGGGYSSLWHFDDCVLLRSSFKSLAQVECGLQANRTTMVDCTLPQRTLKKDNLETAAAYQDKWNAVTDCDFDGCDIAASALWMLKRANLSQNQVTEAPPFESVTDLKVELFVPPWEAMFWSDAVAMTASKYKGEVTLKSSPKEYPRKAPSRLWAWVGARQSAGDVAATASK